MYPMREKLLARSSLDLEEAVIWSDIFELKGKQYSIVVDCFFKFVEIGHLVYL